MKQLNEQTKQLFKTTYISTTMEELKQELTNRGLSLYECLKTPVELCEHILNGDSEDYEPDEMLYLMETNNNELNYKEYAIIDKSYGLCAVFSISNKYNVFDLKVLDNFLTSVSDAKKWLEFLVIMHYAKDFIFDYEHLGQDND